MVLATPIKGAENNNEKGWSRINNSGGDPYDGRYFLRVANKSIIFDYCSPTLHKYNDSMCSKGGKFIPSLNGNFSVSVNHHLLLVPIELRIVLY